MPDELNPKLCIYPQGLLVWRFTDDQGIVRHWSRYPDRDPLPLRLEDNPEYCGRKWHEDDRQYGSPEEQLEVSYLNVGAMRVRATELIYVNYTWPLRHRIVEVLEFRPRFAANHFNGMATMAMLIFVAGMPQDEGAHRLQEFRVLRDEVDLPNYVVLACRRYGAGRG